MEETNQLVKEECEDIEDKEIYLMPKETPI